MAEAGELGTQRGEERRNKAIRQNLASVDEGLRWLMTDPRGRAFVWVLLEDAGVFGPSFHRDPGVMSFNEGRRSGGLKLFADVMRLAPDQYTRMAAEARARAHSKEKTDGGQPDTE